MKARIFGQAFLQPARSKLGHCCTKQENIGTGYAARHFCNQPGIDLDIAVPSRIGLRTGLLARHFCNQPGVHLDIAVPSRRTKGQDMCTYTYGYSL